MTPPLLAQVAVVLGGAAVGLPQQERSERIAAARVDVVVARNTRGEPVKVHHAGQVRAAPSVVVQTFVEVTHFEGVRSTGNVQIVPDGVGGVLGTVTCDAAPTGEVGEAELREVGLAVEGAFQADALLLPVAALQSVQRDVALFPVLTAAIQ